VVATVAQALLVEGIENGFLRESLFLEEVVVIGCPEELR
jgi:hypothetical protein